MNPELLVKTLLEAYNEDLSDEDIQADMDRLLKIHRRIITSWQARDPNEDGSYDQTKIEDASIPIGDFESLTELLIFTARFIGQRSEPYGDFVPFRKNIPYYSRNTFRKSNDRDVEGRYKYDLIGYSTLEQEHVWDMVRKKQRR